MRRVDCLEGRHVDQKLQYLHSFSPGGNKNLCGCNLQDSPAPEILQSQ